MNMEVQRDCICAHVRKATRAVTALYDRFLSPTGLRVTQYSLLMNIKRLEKAAITKLSEPMLMDKTTLSRNVRLLEKKRLVRTRPGRDGRTKQITLTKEGLQALEEARPYWEEAQRNLVERLGKERMDRFISDLAELSEISKT
jgi:DNA-binding MarR family transcriptional regulator